MDSPRHVSTLATHAWTHPKRTNSEARQHPASWTVRATSRHSPPTHGLIPSGQIPKPANTPPHGQSAPCLGFRQAQPPTRHPRIDSSQADKSRSQPTPCLMDSPRQKHTMFTRWASSNAKILETAVNLIFQINIMHVCNHQAGTAHAINLLTLLCLGGFWLEIWLIRSC